MKEVWHEFTQSSIENAPQHFQTIYFPTSWIEFNFYENLNWWFPRKLLMYGKGILLLFLLPDFNFVLLWKVSGTDPTFSFDLWLKELEKSGDFVLSLAEINELSEFVVTFICLSPKWIIFTDFLSECFLAIRNINVSQQINFTIKSFV